MNLAMQAETKKNQRYESSSFGQHSELLSVDFGDNLDTKIEQEEKLEIGKKETQDVSRLKLIIFIVLVTSAVSVASLIFIYIRNSQESKFETQIASDANKMLQAVGLGIENTFRGLDVLATTLVAHARSTNQKWPNVTMEHFANHASKIRSTCAGFLIATCPIVEPQDRYAWEQYASDNGRWVNDTTKIMATDPTYHGPLAWDPEFSEAIFGDNGPIPSNETRKFAPTWLSYPITSTYEPPYNWDYLSMNNPSSILSVVNDGRALLGEPYLLPDPNDPAQVEEAEIWSGFFSDFIDPKDDPTEPVSDILYPIFDELDKIQVVEEDDDPAQHKAVAFMLTSFYWRDIFEDILPSESRGIIVVVNSTCSPSFTYQIDGPKATYLGRGDNHNSEYDHLGVESAVFDLQSFYLKASTYTGVPVNKEYCPCTIRIYPSDTMKADYYSNDPWILAVVSLFIFLFTSVVFIVYDYKVERRQQVVMNSAEKSNALVSSLFPSNVRNKLLDDKAPSTSPNKNELSSFVDNFGSTAAGERDSIIRSRPIADLYPDTTVFFADIAGFTAWSSTRDPCQVFTLLESIYSAFDKIARKRKVFKVETIGDSYVAVAGLPKPMLNHAAVMVRFANDVLSKMSQVTHNLVITLGPDTTDLRLRVGLNSGPTTAGVLRGEKSRFQLFGDTVNTAARMESNGAPGRIQCSQKTADLLIAAGKEHWLTKREELVVAKGKGSMQTYWVEPATMCQTSDHSIGETEVEESQRISDNIHNLIDWNVDVFEGLTKRILENRSSESSENISDLCINIGLPLPRSEITESINIPPSRYVSKNDVSLSTAVKTQLHEYISNLACMYRENPFHNFEHASHVAMSTKKVLDRIVFNNKGGDAEEKSCSGVNLDPLTYFAIIFGALIHDVDHQGVSNMQLIQERTSLAHRYQNQSVAEQNSVDIAWNLLMRPEFQALRQCLFEAEEDLKRFRQILVNVVLATDIFDKELKARRDSRWEIVFCDDNSNNDGASTKIPSCHDKMNRKIAIIIEHVIQTSDVSHTMQHWQVYQKWNYRLFQEMYIAFRSGRSAGGKHPAENWYEGELWFFDNYVIPLAKKLKVCGVFGVSCDELLDYAIDNRLEWESKGREIVNEWTKQVMIDVPESDEFCNFYI